MGAAVVEALAQVGVDGGALDGQEAVERRSDVLGVFGVKVLVSSHG